MRLPMFVMLPFVLVGSAAVAAPAAQPLQSEQRLSEEEVRKILDKAAAKPAQPVEPVVAGVAAPMDPREPPRAVHGEMGVAVGTGGYRSAYGTAAIPLGQDGIAVVSFGTETGGYYRGRR